MSMTREQMIAVCDAGVSGTPNKDFFNNVLDFLITAGYPDVASAMSRLMASMSLHTAANRSMDVSSGISNINFKCQNIMDRTARP